MDTTAQNFTQLFLQLGLESDDASIEAFISGHSLANVIPLHEAPFWNKAQKHFLIESIAEDAQWSEVIDHLDTLLRKP
ncbi:DUF2789 domain-containing protein [Shewanella sp. 125m-7]